MAGLLAAERRLVPLATALTLLAGVFEGAGLLLIVPILMFATDSQGAAAAVGELSPDLAVLVPSHPVEQLALLLAVFVAVMLVRAALILGRDAVLAQVRIRFVTGLRLNLLGNLATAPWERLASLRHGRLTSLVSGELQQCSAAAQGVVQAAVAAVMLTAQFAVALMLSPKLTLFALVVIVPAAAGLLPMLRQADRAGKGLSRSIMLTSDALIQLLAGLKMARSQGIQHLWSEEVQRHQMEVDRHQLEFTIQRSRAAVALSTLSGVGSAIAVLIGYALLDLAPALLLTMLIILARLSGPAMQIYQGVQLFTHGLPFVDEVRRLSCELGQDNRSPIAQLPQQPTEIPFGTISCEAVTYLHPSGGGVRGLDLVVEPGVLVALKGPSGAGKTTLADILSGLILPQRGRVTVAGRPLDLAALPAWHSQIAYIAQESVLFHDTVRRNLLWGAAECSDEAIWQALAIAGAAGLVARLDRDLDTVIGERGGLLSGGERQRIALARALLRRPRLLILDEATSAVDEAAERAILERFRAMLPKPAMLLITHRSRNLDLCDRIVEMESGQMVGDGGLACARPMQSAG